MTGTAWILEFALQPGQSLLQQRQSHGTPLRIAGSWALGVMKQLHQRSTDLLGAAPPLLVFEGMPLAIP